MELRDLCDQSFIGFSQGWCLLATVTIFIEYITLLVTDDFFLFQKVRIWYLSWVVILRWKFSEDIILKSKLLAVKAIDMVGRLLQVHIRGLDGLLNFVTNDYGIIFLPFK